MTDKKITKMLADAVKLGLDCLKEDNFYNFDREDTREWVQECINEEEEKREKIRTLMDRAYQIYSKEKK